MTLSPFYRQGFCDTNIGVMLYIGGTYVGVGRTRLSHHTTLKGKVRKQATERGDNTGEGVGPLDEKTEQTPQEKKELVNIYKLTRPFVAAVAVLLRAGHGRSALAGILCCFGVVSCAVSCAVSLVCFRSGRSGGRTHKQGQNKGGNQQQAKQSSDLR